MSARSSSGPLLLPSRMLIVLYPVRNRYELGIESVDAVTADIAREHVDRNLPPQKDADGRPL